MFQLFQQSQHLLQCDQVQLYKDLIISSEIKILLNKCDTLNKIKALEKINELDDKISFCISFILDSKNFENKLLLIEYLLKNYYSKINNQTLEFLKNRKISIQMYFLIPEDLQDKIVNLNESQNLMIEFLLINQKFEILDKIFNPLYVNSLHPKFDFIPRAIWSSIA